MGVEDPLEVPHVPDADPDMSELLLNFLLLSLPPVLLLFDDFLEDFSMPPTWSAALLAAPGVVGPPLPVLPGVLRPEEVELLFIIGGELLFPDNDCPPEPLLQLLGFSTFSLPDEDDDSGEFCCLSPADLLVPGAGDDEVLPGPGVVLVVVVEELLLLLLAGALLFTICCEAVVVVVDARLLSSSMA